MELPMNIEEFHSDFLQLIWARKEANQDFSRASMGEIACEWLTEESIIEDYTPAYYESNNTIIDGYSISEQNDSVDLFYVDYHSSETPLSINSSEYDKFFNGLKRFFNSAIKGDVLSGMEESAPAYGMAWDINQRAGGFQKIRLFLLTNRTLKTLRDSLPVEKIKNWEVSRHIYDLSRLSEFQSTTSTPITIDFVESYNAPLSCLKASVTSKGCRSYLAAIPGDILAELYKDYGPRLLEQNVRAFLQLRGKVNKGIKRTIHEEPDMFFVYNNGISATATQAVETDDGLGIRSVVDLQIVNGGQTTASLYYAKKANVDLRNIYVQMKLSIVDPDRMDLIVPRISEYANTQNKIDNADFFSNHPFHIRMEGFSRRISTPATDGAIKGTKWFYERTRGQYAEAMNKGNKTEQQKMFPKSQIFTKTDLAKYDNTWEGDDEAVVKVHMGAQKNFALYAERIGNLWEKDETIFSERFYKKAIGKAIIFRHTEKMVSSQPWYQGGYRAQIVAYSQSLLSHHLRQMKRGLDWDRLWLTQSVPGVLHETLVAFARAVNDSITSPPPGMRNISEWCKKSACWSKLKELSPPISDSLLETWTISEKEEERRTSEAKSNQIIDNGIDDQTFVISLPATYWDSVIGFCSKYRVPLISMETGLIEVVRQYHYSRRVPSEKQCIAIVAMLKRLEKEGLEVPWSFGKGQQKKAS
jgi:hypothetical protein